MMVKSMRLVMLLAAMVLGINTIAFSQDVIKVGFEVRSTVEEDTKQLLPLLNYLKKSTGYNFELYVSPQGKNPAEDLGSGTVQFAVFGAGAYLKYRSATDIIPFARGVYPTGKPEYQSVIVVSPDSPIKKVEDLRGKKMAFNKPTSTQGYFVPRSVLEEHKIKLQDLSGYQHTDSHRACANLVIMGETDACGMQDLLGWELEKSGLVRIIHTSKFYPTSGIFTNNKVSPEILANVKKALLDFQPKGKDAEGLYKWDKTEMPNGFADAAASDYEGLAQLFAKYAVK